MYIDILQDYKGLKTKELLVAKSIEHLAGQIKIQKYPKQEARRALLDEHPELRMRLNTQTLKSIIDYSDFKCSPYSSVARDEAVKGSDIDGGIVVSQKRVSIMKQLDFVSEIRNQGFEAYYGKEVTEAHKKNTTEFNRLKREGIIEWDELPNDFKQAFDKVSIMEDQTILFYSQLQINRMIGRGKLIMPLMIYLAGTSLDDIVPDQVNCL